MIGPGDEFVGGTAMQRRVCHPERGSGNRNYCFLGVKLTLTLVSVMLAANVVRGQTYRERVLEESPVFFWTLDDQDIGDVPENLGSSEVNAEFRGNVEVQQDGLVPDEPNNKSARFDGEDAFVHIPDHMDINVTNGPWLTRSWSLWFNADDVNTDEVQMLYEEGGTLRGVNLYIRDGELFLGAWNNATDDGVTAPWISGEDDPPGGNLFLSTPIESGVTYHTALVMDGDEDGKEGVLTGYLNGAVFEEKSGVGRLFNHGANVGIGRKNNDTYYDTGSASGDGDYFAGRVDEVALFHTALTHGEIVKHIGIDSIIGDFNRDGVIDTADFDILAANFNSRVAFPESLEKGDTNFDGKIGMDDFVEFRRIFDAQQGGGAQAVPEPSSYVLALFALLAVRRFGANRTRARFSQQSN